jgi:hypothetical protein
MTYTHLPSNLARYNNTGTQKNNEAVLATHNVWLVMNRNKSVLAVNSCYITSVTMARVIVLWRIKTHTLSRTSNIGVDKKIVDGRNMNCEDKIIILLQAP